LDDSLSYVGGTAYYYLGSTLGLGEDAMVRITLSHPTILGLSVEDNIRPTLAWFVEALHITGDEVVEMVRRQPEILQLSVVENLEPTLEWFQLRLGLNPRAMGAHVVRKFPAVLCYNCEEGLERKVSFLVEALGLEDGVELGRLVVKKHPSLLSASVSWNLMPKVEFLTKEFGLQTEDGSLLKAVAAVPNLLSLSLEQNLRPKAHFFHEDLGFTVEDCKKLVRLCPVIFALSLDARLLPLVAYLQVLVRSLLCSPFRVFCFAFE
jgi:mTERF domain-containing protein